MLALRPQEKKVISSWVLVAQGLEVDIRVLACPSNAFSRGRWGCLFYLRFVFSILRSEKIGIFFLRTVFRKCPRFIFLWKMNWGKFEPLRTLIIWNRKCSLSTEFWIEGLVTELLHSSVPATVSWEWEKEGHWEFSVYISLLLWIFEWVVQGRIVRNLNLSGKEEKWTFWRNLLNRKSSE